jgi:hypothetical protein
MCLHANLKKRVKCTGTTSSQAVREVRHPPKHIFKILLMDYLLGKPIEFFYPNCVCDGSHPLTDTGLHNYELEHHGFGFAQ